MKYKFFSNDEIFVVKTNIPADEFAKHFLRLFDRQLDRAYITDVEKDFFERKYVGSPFRFAWNGWNVFNGIWSGNINIKTDSKSNIYIVSHITFWEYFVIDMLFMFIPIFGEFSNIASRLIFAGVILLFFIFSTILTIYRYNSFIENLVFQTLQLPVFDDYEKSETIKK